MCKYLIAFLFLFCISSAHARITQLEPLNFGKLVVQKNNRVSSITILPSNTSSSTNDIYIFEKGHSAEFALEGFPARAQLTVSDFVSNQIVDNVFGGATFVLNRLIYQNTITTDSFGSALLNVGGQLSTSGDNSTYYDGYYDATVEITVNF